MSGRSFLDSNVLVYIDDHDAPEKQATATAMVEDERRKGTGVVSTQVLQEYFVTATRKLKVPASVARQKIELFAKLNLMIIQLDDILLATDLHRLHQLSFWDALIVRAAQVAACSTLYTEDLQDGRVIDGLKIVNPFRGPTGRRK